MGNFRTLVCFEYKKILGKKAFWIALLLMTVFCGISAAGLLIGDIYVDGVPSMSKYESMQVDRAYELALSGRTIDTDLLTETALAYGQFPMVERVGVQRQAYEEHVRPYQAIGSYLQRVYGLGSYEEVANLTQTQLGQFYLGRDALIEHWVTALPLSEAAKEQLLHWDDDLVTPLTFSYSEGYQYAIVMFQSSALMVAFFLASFLSGMYAKEYQCKTDALILTCRNAKRTLIAAKLWVTISISLLVALIIMAVTYVVCMVAYGNVGADAPFQLYRMESVLPITMGEAMLIFYGMVLCALLLTSAVALLLSALCKSPAVAVAGALLFLYGPMFLPLNPLTVPPLLYNVFNLFPVNTMNVAYMLDNWLVELFGQSIAQFVYIPAVQLVLATVCFVLSKRQFCRHQVT